MSQEYSPNIERSFDIRSTLSAARIGSNSVDSLGKFIFGVFLARLILLGAGYLTGLDRASEPELRFIVILKLGRSEVALAADGPQPSTTSLHCGRSRCRGEVQIWNASKVSSGDGWSEAAGSSISTRFAEPVVVDRVTRSCQ